MKTTQELLLELVHGLLVSHLWWSLFKTPGRMGGGAGTVLPSWSLKVFPEPSCSGLVIEGDV